MIGFHVSAAKGVHNAPINAKKLKIKSFALFLGNQRTWSQKPLDKKEIQSFKKTMTSLKLNPKKVLPHGSYLINAGSPKPEALEKSRKLLLSEVERCKDLGLHMYNFHPGSHLREISEKECIKKVGETINWIHKKTTDVKLVIENTAGQGSNIGYSFEHLRDIVAEVQDKTRVGVCLDTCHLFAAGYDLRTKDKVNKVMGDFDKIIGFQYLSAFHLNDSKGDLGSRLDRHANLGTGYIGTECFSTLLQDPRFAEIPMILETEGPDEDEVEVAMKLQNGEDLAIKQIHFQKKKEPSKKKKKEKELERTSTLDIVSKKEKKRTRRPL